LNALQRSKIGFNFNTSYNFTLTISTSSNPYKSSASLTIPITFLAPSKSDYKNNYDISSSCQSLLASGGVLTYVNSAYSKVMKYDIVNSTNLWFNLNSTNTSTSCKNGAINEQIALIYIYDTAYFDYNIPA
jgi:hypothetical protein